jgi:hypothetical protein
MQTDIASLPETTLRSKPKKGNRTRNSATKRTAVLLRSDSYARDNQAIAAQVLANPENHITGLVEWAKLVTANDTAFHLESAR